MMDFIFIFAIAVWGFVIISIPLTIWYKKKHRIKSAKTVVVIGR